MSTTSTPKQHIHLGHNIKRYREMMGIKQQAVAIDLGEDWNQKKVSRLEEKEVIDKELLEKVSKILNIPMETLESQDAGKAMVSIQNNYEGANPGVANVASGSQQYESCSFNPLDEVKRLNDENKALYERLLAAEKEKNDMLQLMVDKLK